jgi:hypothetical protein
MESHGQIYKAEKWQVLSISSRTYRMNQSRKRGPVRSPWLDDRVNIR